MKKVFKHLFYFFKVKCFELLLKIDVRDTHDKLRNGGIETCNMKLEVQLFIFSHK